MKIFTCRRPIATATADVESKRRPRRRAARGLQTERRGEPDVRLQAGSRRRRGVRDRDRRARQGRRLAPLPGRGHRGTRRPRVLRPRLGAAGRQRLRPGPARRPSPRSSRSAPATCGWTCRAGRPRSARAGGCARCSTSPPSRPARTSAGSARRCSRSSPQSARGADRPAVPQRLVDEAQTAAEAFLVRWRGEPDPLHVKALDAYWVSAAEHGMNASTFTARVIASTGADVAAAHVRRGRRPVGAAARRRPGPGAAHARGGRADRRRRRVREIDARPP